MPHRFPSLGLPLLLLPMLAAATQAQDRIAAEIYGHGVHSYYRGDLMAANELFDEAINAGFNDPRVYYFRAISKLQGCDTWGAENDIRLGANLEVNGSGAYNVGRSLERVQGNLRVKFERMRRQARLEAQLARANQPPPALPPIMPTPARDLQQVPPAPTQPLIPEAVPGADNPFADDKGGETLDAPAADQPTTDADDMVDPFSDDAAAEDPFGDVSPMENAPPAAEDDPFGDAAPPAEAAPAIEDDPFGGPDALDDSAPLPEVGNEDDLFGAAVPAEDPFGGNSLNKASTPVDELDSLFSE